MEQRCWVTPTGESARYVGMKNMAKLSYPGTMMGENNTGCHSVRHVGVKNKAKLSSPGVKIGDPETGCQCAKYVGLKNIVICHTLAQSMATSTQFVSLLGM